MVGFMDLARPPFVKAADPADEETGASKIGVLRPRQTTQTLPEFLERKISPKLTYSQMESMALNNVWVRAIHDKILRRLIAVEPVVKALLPEDSDEPTDEMKREMDRVMDLMTRPNNPCTEDLSTIRRKGHSDLLTYDAAALEIVRPLGQKDGPIIGFYSLPGDMIRKNVDKRGNYKDPAKAYHQVDGSRILESFGWNQLVYMMLNPRSGYDYGTSPLETLVSTVMASLYADYHNLQFFANDATPAYTIMFNNTGLSGDALMTKIKRWQYWFDLELRGRPHRPIILANDAGTVDVRQIGMSQRDMQFLEYSMWLLQKIMAVYGMQPMVLGVTDRSTGRLNSEQQERQFKEDAIKPPLRYWAETMSRNFIWDPDFGLGNSYLYIDYYGLDLTDDSIQAEIDERYVRNGILTINEIRAELGYEPVWWGYVPYINATYQPIIDAEDLAEPPARQQRARAKDKKDDEPDAKKMFSPEEWKAMVEQFSKYPSGLSPENEKKAVKALLKKRYKKHAWLMRPDQGVIVTRSK